jgi:hypothetical protein
MCLIAKWFFLIAKVELREGAAIRRPHGGVVVVTCSFWKLDSAAVGNSIFPAAAWWRQRRRRPRSGVHAGGRSWIVGPRPKKIVEGHLEGYCCSVLLFPSQFFYDSLNIIIEGEKFNKPLRIALSPSACPYAVSLHILIE